LKKIIIFSLNNKFAIWILTIMVVVAGLFSGFNMKQEAMPNITLPNVSIITVYPGAAPDEVADNVTVPIEERIQNLKGVELVSSSSLANTSSVQIQFDFDTDMDVATNEVKEALSNLSLPEGAADPEVSRTSLNAFPVIALSISHSEHSLEDLTTTLEEEVLPTLEGLAGVSDVQITGQQMTQVSIDFGEEKLNKYGLTKDTVEQIIQGSNLMFPLGLTTFDQEVKNLVIDGDISTVDDLKSMRIPVVPSRDDVSEVQQEIVSEQDVAQRNEEEIPTVQLDELADIKIVEKAQSISRTNGKDSIGLQVVKASDANTVDVVNRVKNTIDSFESEFGLTVTSTFDQGTSIEESVDMMLDKALFGILFAIVIILLFLRSIKRVFGL